MTSLTSVLVVRGDLNSTSGYTRATGLYLSKLESSYDAVVGVDLHRHEARLALRWEYPAIDAAGLSALLERTDLEVDVLTLATPAHYRRFPARRNIGCFFWETDRLGQPGWATIINSTVDEMWVPARFMGQMLVEAGVTVPVHWKPCPLPRHHHDEAIVDDIVVLEPDLTTRGVQRLLPIASVRESSDVMFLSVNTFIPRKGLALMVHEWQSVVDTRPEASLILKVGTIDVTKTRADVQRAVEQAIASTWTRRVPPRIYLSLGSLSASRMAGLSAITDAQLTTSFGEGFGLGVFESLAAGRAALCPRHTSLAELLPDDYPYFLDTDWANYGLADPTGLYPISARWGVPREGALRAAIDRYVSDRDAGLDTGEIERAEAHAVAVAQSGSASWNI